MTTPSGGTADLVAELRAQAQAAVARAVETREQVAREINEVRDQATAVAAALESGARQSAELLTAESQRSNEAIIGEARSMAAAAIAEAEAQAASIRVTATAAGDEADAALARAEVRHESAAVQADALRLTARREATIHRRRQLEDTHHAAHTRLDGVSDTISRLGVTLEDLGQALADLSPVTTRLRADIATPPPGFPPEREEPAGDAESPVEPTAESTEPVEPVEPVEPAERRVENLFDFPDSASDRGRGVRHR